MIRLKDYRNYFKLVCTRLLIPTMRTVVSEQQIISYIKDLPDSAFPAMFLVIPSADTIAADEDSIFEPSTGVLFLLSKVDSTNETEDSMADNLQVTQDLMQNVKKMMRDDKANHSPDHLLDFIDFNRLHTDPEINLAGCNGWSLSFIINTPGF